MINVQDTWGEAMSGTINIDPGIFREHLKEHHKLYPAVQKSKIREIEARLLRVDTVCVDPTYCPLRSLKKEYAYALNSVRLHNSYFENIGEPGSKPSPELVNVIERYFGSFEEWEMQFTALALCSRGWVILGFDLTDGALRNFFADDHSEGVWSVIPLLVPVIGRILKAEFQRMIFHSNCFFKTLGGIFHPCSINIKPAVCITKSVMQINLIGARVFEQAVVNNGQLITVSTLYFNTLLNILPAGYQFLHSLSYYL
jgi:Fe-Mn family superoxide dismutase